MLYINDMLNEIIKMIELSKNTKGQDWRHNINQIKIKINEYAKEYHESQVKKLNIPDVMAMLPIGMVNRIEVIDEKGRSYVNWQKYNRVELQVQDNGRTLKVFVSQGN